MYILKLLYLFIKKETISDVDDALEIYPKKEWKEKFCNFIRLFHSFKKLIHRFKQ